MKILDVACGSKMFYFQKNHPNVTYMDIREEKHILSDGRSLEIKPDLIGDFRNIPFENETFDMVVFDPPHLKDLGMTSWLAKKYGKLLSTWDDDISQGFEECFRVLKNNGTLIFKWNEQQIKLKDILSLTKEKPLFGQVSGKTHWLVFIKLPKKGD
jgi:ubiquinone/menaquinone biosynthesis C-methylase UbiE